MCDKNILLYTIYSIYTKNIETASHYVLKLVLKWGHSHVQITRYRQSIALASAAPCAGLTLISDLATSHPCNTMYYWEYKLIRSLTFLNVLSIADYDFFPSLRHFSNSILKK